MILFKITSSEYYVYNEVLFFNWREKLYRRKKFEENIMCERSDFISYYIGVHFMKARH